MSRWTLRSHRASDTSMEITPSLSFSCRSPQLRRKPSIYFISIGQSHTSELLVSTEDWKGYQHCHKGQQVLCQVHVQLENSSPLLACYWLQTSLSGCFGPPDRKSAPARHSDSTTLWMKQHKPFLKSIFSKNICSPKRRRETGSLWGLVERGRCEYV